MTFPRFHRLALLLALSACGGGTSTDAGTDAASAVIDAPGLDAPTSSMEDAPAAASDGGDVCAYVDTIDRSCTMDSDCLVRLHQTDCCGNSVMIGIASSANEVYLASEPACMAGYPACECPAMPPRTDSDETVTDTKGVLAACVSRGPRNVCLTYVTMRPPDGR
jgi:hypothetical protein